MYAHVGMVAQGFDQGAESRFSDGDVLVVGIVFATEDEIGRTVY